MKASLLAVAVLATIAISSAVDEECIQRKLSGLATHWPNPTNCSSFYRCTNKSIKRHILCPAGKEYNIKSGRCGPMGRNLCKLSLRVALDESLNTCTNVLSGTYVGDTKSCRNFNICNNNLAYPQSCDVGSYYDTSKAVCIPDSKSQCWENLCLNKENGLYIANQNDCYSFYICSNDVAVPQECPSGSYFVKETLNCRPGVCPYDVTTTTCTEFPTDSTTQSTTCTSTPTITTTPCGVDETTTTCTTEDNSTTPCDDDITTPKVTTPCDDDITTPKVTTHCDDDITTPKVTTPCDDDITTPKTTDEECAKTNCDQAKCVNAADLMIFPALNGNSKLFCVCINHEAVCRECPEGSEFLPNVGACFPTQGTTSDDDDTTTCTTTTPTVEDNTSTPCSQVNTTPCDDESHLKCNIALCKNAEDHSSFPLPGTNTAYCVCIKNKPEYRECAEGTIYNTVLGICALETETPAPVKCKGDIEDGEFVANPNNCMLFYICFDGEFFESSCGTGNYFNETSKSCTLDTEGKCPGCTNDQPAKLRSKRSVTKPQSGTDGCCPGGYQNGDVIPHPTDCAKKMVCYNGELKEESCGEGFYFNAALKECVKDVNNVCRPATPSECVEGQVEEHPFNCSMYLACCHGVLKEKSCDQGYYFKSAANECVKDNNNICWPKDSPTCEGGFEENQLVPNPANCSSYFKCSNGELKPQHCDYGYYYSIAKYKCVEDVNNICWPEKAPTCPGGIKEGEKVENPADCASYLMCCNEQLKEISCGNNMFYDKLIRDCRPDTTNTCWPKRPTCDGGIEEGGELQNPADCASYLKCSNGELKAVSCGNGMVYNSKIGQCEVDSKNICWPKEPTCEGGVEEGEKIPNPKNCSSYLVCCHGDLTEEFCGKGMLFDKKSGQCKSDINNVCWPKDPICKEGYKVLNPDDCASYLKCSNGELEVVSCGKGMVYNSKKKQCEIDSKNSCWPKEPTCEGGVEEGEKVPNPKNCSSYLVCCHGDLTEEFCGKGMLFDKKSGQCKSDVNNVCWPKDPICKEGDKVPNPDDCASYLKCSNGELEVVSCGKGMVYNSKKKQCEIDSKNICWPKEPTCEGGVGEGEKVPNPKNCSSYLVCCHGDLTEEFCGKGMLFDKKSGQCKSDVNNVCWPKDPICKEGDKVPNPDDCASYLKCSNGELEVVSCGKGMVYNSKKGQCEVDSKNICWPKEPTCEGGVEEGKKVPNPKDCSSYLVCCHGDLTEEFCGKGMLFDKKSGQCESDVNNVCWPKDPICKEGDKVPNPDDCASYLKCSNGELAVVSCGKGMVYNSKKGQCEVDSKNICWPKEPTCEGGVEEGEKVPNPKNCSSYLVCCHGDLTEEFCGKGMLFDKKSGQCKSDINNVCWPKDPICKEGDKVLNPDDCASYLKCSNGELAVVSCGKGMVYNSKKKQCEIDSKNSCWPKEPTCEGGVEEGEKVPNPKNCSSYLVCCHGDLTEEFCGKGMLFDKKSGQCKSDVNNVCWPKDPICKEGDKVPNPDDCASYLKCSNGELEVVSCGKGMVYNSKKGQCEVDSKNICWPKEPTCEGGVEEGKKVPNPKDCSSYLVCCHGDLTEEFCGKGMLFDKKSGQCESDVNNVCWPKDPICKEGDKVPNPDDCASYLKCSNGELEVVSCGKGMVYNSKKGQCEVDSKNICWPKEPTCEGGVEEGEKVPNPKDCSSYLVCCHGDLTEEFCGKGMLFDKKSGQCKSDVNNVCWPKDPICKEGDKVPNPADCASYLQCSSGELKVVVCGSGMMYNSKRGKCEVDTKNICWPKEPSTPNDDDITTPKVTTPCYDDITTPKVTTPRDDITTPKVTTPRDDITTPKVTTPCDDDITTPKVTTPCDDDITTPKVTTPCDDDITTPKVTTPRDDITTPKVTTPRDDITTPKVTTPCDDDITTPKVTTPCDDDITTPKVTTPCDDDITTPKVTTPRDDITTPKVTTPCDDDITTPKVTTPCDDITTPKVTTPCDDDITTPKVTTPCDDDITTPKVTTPCDDDITTPKVTTPRDDITTPKVTTPCDDDITTPKVTTPRDDITTPKVTTPRDDITTPKVTTPCDDDITTPKVTTPCDDDITTPKVTTPCDDDITTPKVTTPCDDDITTPKVTTPRDDITTPKVTTPRDDITTPKVTTPCDDDITTPKVTTPCDDDITTPKVTTPCDDDITTPKVTTPRDDITTPKVTTPCDDDITTPKVTTPCDDDITTPKVTTPRDDITTPKVTTPCDDDITTPKVTTPCDDDITTPKVTTPCDDDITTPKVTTPRDDITTPKVTTPCDDDITTPKVTTPRDDITTPKVTTPCDDDITTPKVTTPCDDDITTPKVTTPCDDDITTPKVTTPCDDDITTPKVNTPCDDDITTPKCSCPGGYQEGDTSPAADCDKYYTCVGGIQVLGECGINMYYNATCGTCDPDTEHKCWPNYCADQPNGAMVKNPKQCNAFYLCNNGESRDEVCETGQWFDPTQSSCQPDMDAVCYNPCACQDKIKMLPHPDCTKFYFCNGNQTIVEKCPVGGFDITIGDCNPQKKCSDNECEGKPDYVTYGDAQDKTKFYVCLNGVAVLKNCLPNTEYNGAVCAHVSSPDCDPKPCSSQEYLTPYATLNRTEENAFCICRLGYATKQYCAADYIFSSKREACYSDAPCDPLTCIYGHDYTVSLNRNDTKSFCLCTDKKAVIVSCPNNGTFNPVLLECSNITISTQCDQIECINREDYYTYPDSTGSTKGFCMCKGHVGIFENCSEDSSFDVSMGACRLNNIQCNSSKCKGLANNTKIPALISSQGYCECVNDKATYYNCRNNAVFNAASQECKDPLCDPIKCEKANDYTLFPAVGSTHGFCMCLSQEVVYKPCDEGGVFNSAMLVCQMPLKNCVDSMCLGVTANTKLPADYSIYGYCSCTGDKATFKECPNGQVFDLTTKSCETEKLPIQDVCDTTYCGDPTHAGQKYPSINSIYGYCECSPVGTSFHPCPNGEIFDSALMSCRPTASSQCDLSLCSDATPNNGYPIPTKTGTTSFCYCTGPGNAMLINCPNGLYYNDKQKICVATIEEGCSCPGGLQNGDVVEDTNDCSQYYLCNSGTMHKQSCPSGQYFKPDCNKCVDDTTGTCVKKEACSCLGTYREGERLVHPYNEQMYYVCENRILHERNCGTGRIFNKAINQCMRAPRTHGRHLQKRSVDVHEFYCLEEEKRSVASNCSQYEICRNQTWRLQSCSPFNYYNPEQKQCLEPRDDIVCAYAKVRDLPKCDEAIERQLYKSRTCQQYFRCKKGKWHLNSCGKDEYYNTRVVSCLAHHLGEKFECSHLGNNTEMEPSPDTCQDLSMRPYAQNCAMYLMCSGNQWWFNYCPLGMYFNRTLNFCLPDEENVCPAAINSSQKVNATNEGLLAESCQQEGFLRPSALACNRYYICIGGQWKQQNCGSHNYYDAQLNQCSPDTKGICQQLKADCIPEEKRLLPGNCSVYEKCSVDGKWTRWDCPQGEIYDDILQQCVANDGICSNGGLRKVCSPQETRKLSINCTQFYYCNEEQWAVGSCLKGCMYWPEKKKCVPYSNEDKCKPLKEGQSQHLPGDANETNSCVDQLDGVYIANISDCTRYYICVNGAPSHAMQCPSGSFFDRFLGFCRPNDGSCRLPLTGECENATESAFVAHATDCQSYYLCSFVDGQQLKHCPEGQYYHNYTRQCRVDHGECKTPSNPDSNFTGKCFNKTHGIRLAHETYCNKYFVCVNGLAIPIECPDSYQFNASISQCIYDQDNVCEGGKLMDHNLTSCGNFSDGSYIANRQDCTRYYICSAGQAQPKKCSGSTYFDDKQSLCVPDDGSCPFVDNDEPNKYRLPPNQTICEGKHGNLMPDPVNCNNFYVCVNSKLRHDRCYPQFFFNTTLNQCQQKSMLNHTMNKKNETRMGVEMGTKTLEEATTKLKAIQTHECSVNTTSIEILCEEYAKGSTIAEQGDCRFYITCEEGGATTSQRCRNGESYDSLLGFCRQNDGTCQMDSGQRAGECSERHGQLARDTNNCHKYYICINGQKIAQSCAEGEYFSKSQNLCIKDTLNTCVPEPAAEELALQPQSCNGLSEFILYPYIHDNCRSYFQCVQGVVKVHQCADKLYFDPTTLKCVQNRTECVMPSKSQQRSPVFTKQNFEKLCTLRDMEMPYANFENNCRSFYTCHADGEVSHELCPLGTAFDNNHGNCMAEEKVICN